MREVINDKCQHDQSAHHHVTRRKRCFDVALVYVPLRAGTPVFDCQLDGHVDVNENSGQQENSDQPKQRTEIAQMLRVSVDQMRLAAEFQIMDAGWSVKLQRLPPCGAPQDYLLCDSSRKTFPTYGRARKDADD